VSGRLLRPAVHFFRDRNKGAAIGPACRGAPTFIFQVAERDRPGDRGSTAWPVLHNRSSSFLSRPSPGGPRRPNPGVLTRVRAGHRWVSSA